MRLRRETGDFKLTSTLVDQTLTWATIPKGLSAEDLVGTVVEAEASGAHSYEVITGATPDDIDGTPVIRLSAYGIGTNLVYNPATGEVYISSD